MLSSVEDSVKCRAQLVELQDHLHIHSFPQFIHVLLWYTRSSLLLDALNIKLHTAMNQTK